MNNEAIHTLYAYVIQYVLTGQLYQMFKQPFSILVSPAMLFTVLPLQSTVLH